MGGCTGALRLCPASSRRKIVGMSAKPIRIVLDVNFLDELPTGQATSSEGASSGFVGWLGLMSTLEALLSQTVSEPAEEPTDDPFT